MVYTYLVPSTPSYHHKVTMQQAQHRAGEKCIFHVRCSFLISLDRRTAQTAANYNPEKISCAGLLDAQAFAESVRNIEWSSGLRAVSLGSRQVIPLTWPRQHCPLNFIHALKRSVSDGRLPADNLPCRSPRNTSVGLSKSVIELLDFTVISHVPRVSHARFSLMLTWWLRV